MKSKVISLVLAAIFFLTVFAHAKTDDIASVALSVKKKLDIPSNYTDFHSELEQNEKGRLIRLSWSGDTAGNERGGRIEAIVDELGRIIYYNHYEYGNYEGDYKLSGIDYNAAVKIAEKFLVKVCPEFALSLKPLHVENYIERNYNNYMVRFVRYENDVPFYNNYAIVAINAHNEKTSELMVEWDDIDKFPRPVGVLPVSKAKERFKEKIGIRIAYYNNNQNSVSLLYGVREAGREYINAFTGDVTDTNIIAGRFAAVYSEYEKSISHAQRFEAAAMPDGLMPPAQAADAVRRFLQAEGELPLSSISRTADTEGNYYYNIGLLNKGVKSNIEINAKTAEITGYYKDEEYSELGIISEDKACDIAAQFAKRAALDKFNSCFEAERRKVRSQFGGYNYRFVFWRNVKGLQYKDNGILIDVCAATGEVLMYSCNWEERDFPSEANVISAGSAYDELFDKAGFELMYVPVSRSKLKIPASARDAEVRLVYSFRQGKPLYVNASTGGLCYSDSTPYSDSIGGAYEDIKGHPSEKFIKILLGAKIFEQSEFFRPDDNITQADYLKWIYRAVRKYSPDTETLYGTMYYLNVLNEGERSDNGSIVFEDAVKFIIRLLGYTDVAELSDTYKTGFIDEGMITPGLVGYAAIAQGLGIVKGNAFLPKRYVTRATAAEIIYNVLTSEQNGKAEK